jgi:hypothetical protein
MHDAPGHWPDRAVVKLEDFYYEAVKRYPLVDKWITLLEDHGYEIVDHVDVNTSGLRHGANRHPARTEAALIYEHDPT